MKSIRRSLILYFLLLLGIALSLVCGLMYEITVQTLEAKQLTAEQLRNERFEEQWRLEQHQRDVEILTQARTLAGLIESQVQWQKLRILSYTPLGVLTAGLSPYGYVQMPIWLGESYRSGISTRIHRLLATELQFNEDILPRPATDIPHDEFFQVTTEWGNIWRSRALGTQSMPKQLPAFEKGSGLDWKFDDVTLDSGVKVRRVVLKAPLARYRYKWPQMPGPPRDFRRSSSPPSTLTVPAITRGDPNDRVTESVLPNIFIQCAWEIIPFEQRKLELMAERDEDLVAIHAETETTLSKLRNRLWWISIVTFATVVFGGTLLIRTGLLPLRRISMAVSQVSAKDFHLPIEGVAIPIELMPIVDRLSQTLKMLENAFEREKQSVADISHELRTPLASLLVTLDVSLRKPRTADQYRETLQDCRVISKQMSHLVERIMTLACLDANTVQLSDETVDIGEMVDACATMMRPIAEANGITLYVERDLTLETRTDPDKLREILVNLIHNAVEYNTPGGKVELISRSSVDGITMEVRDNGIGIPLELQEKIFERFYRQDASRHATGIHAGLGLAIVKEYVSRLGGSIAVESAVGVGSTFRIRLPSPESRMNPHGGNLSCA